MNPTVSITLTLPLSDAVTVLAGMSKNPAIKVEGYSVTDTEEVPATTTKAKPKAKPKAKAKAKAEPKAEPKAAEPAAPVITAEQVQAAAKEAVDAAGPAAVRSLLKDGFGANRLSEVDEDRWADLLGEFASLKDMVL